MHMVVHCWMIGLRDAVYIKVVDYVIVINNSLQGAITCESLPMHVSV